MSYARPSITLAELWERTSQHGNTYFAGFWGHLSVALLFAGERPHPTRPGEVVKVWRLVAQEQERREGVPKPPASPPERVEAPARENGPPAAAARPDGSRRRRASGKARQARVADEVAAAYGLGSDPSDEIPF
jgi:hypothetical protein